MEHDLSKVTRQDRAIYAEEWIVDFLQRAQVGTVSTAVLMEDGAPQPFANPLLFVYHPGRRAIYVHKGRRGRLWENAQVNARVCFSAFEMGRLLPADTALNFSVEYQSVVAFGTICLVEDAQEAEESLQMLLDKYFPALKPGQDYRPITAGERDVTAVFRIDVSEWSGKKK